MLSPPDPSKDDILPLEKAADILTERLGKGWSASALRQKIKDGELRQGLEYYLTPASTVINVSAIYRWLASENWPA